MGKKRVITQKTEELLKEREEIESKFGKSIIRSKALPKKIDEGYLYISSSYNNTILTFTDLKGNVLAWVSAGRLGFKGTKKGTPFAASKTAETMGKVMKSLGVEKISILVKGVGAGREAALRSLAAKDIEIVAIKDITPVPHGGCRPPRVRRV